MRLCFVGRVHSPYAPVLASRGRAQGVLCAQSATSRTLTHCSGHARLARPRESPWPMVATSTELTQELAKAIPVVKLWKLQ